MKKKAFFFLKFSINLTLINMLLFLSSVMADVTLMLPEGITLLAVNGENTKIEKQTRLPDGLNQIVLQHHGEYGFGGNDLELEFSDVFVVTFSAENQMVSMRPTGITKKHHYQKFNKHPKIELVGQNGEQIEIYIGKLKKSGFQIMRNYKEELIEFNKSNSPATLQVKPLKNKVEMTETVPVKETQYSNRKSASNRHEEKPITMVNKTNQKASSQSAAPAGSTDNIAEKMLKYWYEQADEATRDRFKRWINK